MNLEQVLLEAGPSEISQLIKEIKDQIGKARALEEYAKTHKNDLIRQLAYAETAMKSKLN